MGGTQRAVKVRRKWNSFFNCSFDDFVVKRSLTAVFPITVTPEPGSIRRSGILLALGAQVSLCFTARALGGAVSFTLSMV